MARSTAVLFIVAGILMSSAIREAGAAITCGQVASKISSCISYIQGKGPLTPACCGGVKSLNSAAQTTPDRQAVCVCLKKFAGSISGLNLSLAGGVPGKCGVHVPYSISPSVDCTKVR